MKKSKNKNTKKSQVARTVPASQIVYSGPITVPYTSEAEEIVQELLTFEVAATANVAGAITTVFTSDPLFADSISAYYQLSGFQALYRQYRTLGFEINYYPNAVNAVSVVGFGYSPLTTVIDREISTPLTSYGGAAIYPSCKYRMLNGIWRVSAKMSSTQDSEFIQVGTVNPFAYYIKVFGQDMIANDVYGRFFCRMLVQFRGRT